MLQVDGLKGGRWVIFFEYIKLSINNFLHFLTLFEKFVFNEHFLYRGKFFGSFRVR